MSILVRLSNFLPSLKKLRVDCADIEINGTAVTATAAELNILDGVTATAAELNALDGITATVAELNIMDGVTATAAELNILDGVTATASELNTLDGVTRGSIIVGGASDVPSELVAKTSGQILVGNGTDLVSVAVSGGATLSAAGALTLAVPKVSVISKVCAIASFTDNTNTTGYIDFTADSLPAGAIPICWKAVVTGGFGGDTTAVIQLGIAGDLDRFSADTAQSVFAAGTVGSAVLAADACDGIGAVSTPRVTVTGGADFTSIVTDATGAMTVYLYYIATA